MSVLQLEPEVKLARPENFTAVMKHKPTIIIQGENHINSIPDGDDEPLYFYINFM